MRLLRGPVAQSVEQRIENPRVTSSILVQATIICFNIKGLQKCRPFLLGDVLMEVTTGFVGVTTTQIRDARLASRMLEKWGKAELIFNKEV